MIFYRKYIIKTANLKGKNALNRNKTYKFKKIFKKVYYFFENYGTIVKIADSFEKIRAIC